MPVTDETTPFQPTQLATATATTSQTATNMAAPQWPTPIARPEVISRNS